MSNRYNYRRKSSRRKYQSKYRRPTRRPPPRRQGKLWIWGLASFIVLLAGLGVLIRAFYTSEDVNQQISLQADAEGALSDSPTQILPSHTPLATAVTSETITNPITQNLSYVEYSADGQRSATYDASGQVLLEDSQAGNLPENIPTVANLATTADLQNLNAIGLLTAAAFDPESEQLVLIGEPADDQTGTSAADFLVALHSVFSDLEPGVSIDPGPNQRTQTVRYIGSTERTAFGWIMFEADRLMKNLSLGEDNETGEPITSAVPGHGTMFDFSFAYPGETGVEIRRRFWFTVANVQLGHTEDGLGIVFQDIDIQVETEYLDQNWQTLEIQMPDPAGQAFADQLTQHYDEYAQEFPVLRDLESLVRWMALARWIEETPQVINIDALLSTPVDLIDTPEMTPAITVEQSRSTTTSTGEVIETITLWGGVDLDFSIEYSDLAAEEANNLAAAIETQKECAGARCSQASRDENITSLQTSTLYKGYSLDLELPSSLSSIGGEKVFTMIYDSTSSESNISSPGWLIGVPHLEFPLPEQEYEEWNEELYPTIVWVDTIQGHSHPMVYQGNIDEQGNLLYINQEAGLLLTWYASGFSLQKATFYPDGGYSQSSEFRQDFNRDGFSVKWVSDSGSLVSYAYTGGLLKKISGPEGDVDFKYNQAGNLIQITNQETGDSRRFDYNDQGHLVRTISTAGAVISSFVYDDDQRLVEQRNGDDIIESQLAYDNSGRLLARTHDSTVLVYDWLADGGARIYGLGAGSSHWVEGLGTPVLKQLGTVIRISLHGASVDHVLYVRKLDDKALMLLDGRTHVLPLDALSSSRIFRNAINELNPAINPDDIVLVADGDSQDIDFQAAFPDYRWLTSEGLDESQILRNLDDFESLEVLMPDVTELFLGVPRPEEVTKVGLKAANRGDWAGVLEQYIELAERWDFEPATVQPEKKLAQRMEEAFKDKAAVLIVVAHSDGEKIYLPDGTYFSPDELSQDARDAIAANRPVVILVSCQTAQMNDTRSLAKKLIDLGARFVVAPKGNIPAVSTVEFLKSFFENSAKNQRIPDALWNASRFIYEIYKNIQFEKIIGQTPPIDQDIKENRRV